MSARRLIPLTGTVGVVVLVVAFAAGGSPPTGKASAQKVASFYAGHGTTQTVSGVLLSLGALLFLIFAATFAARVGRAPGAPAGAAALCLAGAVVLVVGLTIYAGLNIALGDVATDVSGAALQALNVLNQEAVFVFLITIGSSAFLLGAGIAVLTLALLPRWLGWLAIALAIVGAIPSHVLGGALDHIGFLAFAGLGIWTVIVGVMLAARADAAA